MEAAPVQRADVKICSAADGPCSCAHADHTETVETCGACAIRRHVRELVVRPTKAPDRNNWFRVQIRRRRARTTGRRWVGRHVDTVHGRRIAILAAMFLGVHSGLFESDPLPNRIPYEAALGGGLADGL